MTPPPIRHRRGSYAVEFVLLMPLWLGFLFASLDLAWLGLEYARLSAALDEACGEAATLMPGDATVQSTVASGVDEALARFGTTACTGCTITGAQQGAAPARFVACNASKDVPPLAPWTFPTVTIDVARVAPLAFQTPYTAAP